MKMKRREFLKLFGAMAVMPQAGLSWAGQDAPKGATIAAAWRGPNAYDTYYAGVLAADWARKKLEIRHAVALPTRPHGLTPEADGSLLVTGVRPGGWLMRIDRDGKQVQLIDLTNESSNARLNGHVVVGVRGDVIYTTETDSKSGRGLIGVRDAKSLKKLAEWDSHGLEPHQLLLDDTGCLMIANGGIPRTPNDKKFDLHRMESSLVRLDGQSGRLLRQWTLENRRLSLRHLAWSQGTTANRQFLGVALQAEHDDPVARMAAPILAVLNGDELCIPTRVSDGAGYAGDIVPAYNGGFALSSNQVGLAQLWHPGQPDKLTRIVELQEAYALTGWEGPDPGGGVLVSTALGLVRWHPSAKPALLPWPEKMAVDNHWVLIDEA